MRNTVNYVLEPESNIMPLKFRRALIGLQYMSRIYKIQNHITRDIFENYYQYQCFEERTRRKTFPLSVVGRIKKWSTKLKLPINKLEQIKTKDVNICSHIKAPFSLGKVKKDDIDIKQKFLELKSTYEDYIQIYTDGSKSDKRTGCAFVTGNVTCKYRLRHI